MEKLIQDLLRLYFLPAQQWRNGQTGDSRSAGPCVEGALPAQLIRQCLEGGASAALDLVNSSGGVRTLVVSFERSADWEHVASLYAQVQSQLELPAPAVSVSGKGGYQLWFSLAEAVPLVQAQDFLAGLHRKFLPTIAAHHLTFHPGETGQIAGESGWVGLVPALHGSTGRWSAFIDPSWGSMFIDEPGLEMAPNMDGQAELLAKKRSIESADFQRALNSLGSFGIQGVAGESPAERSTERHIPAVGATLSVGNNFSDPKSFLLAVMNDSAATAEQRIEAAKALLPYCEQVETR